LRHLTEDIVKRQTLRFLKGYYKYRPRGGGDTVARLDMRAEGGIIADGYLKFQQPDGSSFLATFEATSRLTQQEVRYQRQPILLNLDGAVVGSWVTVIAYFYAWRNEWLSMQEHRSLLVALILFLLFVMTLLFFKLAFGFLQRYRYIYAIEQFKEYDADEQWVALAHDVFDHSNLRPFKELKRQCVRSGFGLLLVDEDEKVHLVITPSREQVIKNRKRRSFVDLSTMTKVVSERMKKGNVGWQRLWGKLPSTSINRFRRTYYNQFILLGVSLIGIGIIFGLDYRANIKRQYVDERVYLDSMVQISTYTRPEPLEYLVDTAFLDQFADLPADPIPTPSSSADQPETPQQDTLVNKVVDFECGRFLNLDGTKYLVVYGFFREEENARQQLDQFSLAELEADLIWIGCFDPQADYFAVYLGLFYNTLEEAASQKERFYVLLEERGIKRVPLAIRTLQDER
jgi:hypothetical protein